MWNELWAPDTNEAFTFYEALAGYEREDFGEVAGAPYVLLVSDEHYRAGLLRIPFDGVPAHWVPYVMKEDPAAVAAKVEGLGGRLLLSPDDTRHHGAAVIVDPTGAVFGVQRRPEDLDLDD